MKVSSDESYQLLAARNIHKQLNALTRQFKGIHENTDIECVHQARVASRRLRAGLVMFGECYPAKKVKTWRKEMQRVTKRLGAARDKDVAVAFVQQLLKDLKQKEYRPGIARILLRLEQDRTSLQPKVIKAVDHIDSSRILDEMYAAVGGVLFGLKRRLVTIQSPYVYQKAHQHIRNRLEDMLGYQECLEFPEDYTRHHQMRISAKRLRYTLEICRDVYNGKLDETIKKVKKLQTLLGDIHDCDVWVDDLRAFHEEERLRTLVYFGHARPFTRLSTGIEYLQQERSKYRKELFGKLKENWKQCTAENAWEKLIHILDTQVKQNPDQKESEEQTPVNVDLSSESPEEVAHDQNRQPESEDSSP